MSNLSQKKIVTCHDINGKTYQVSADQLSFRPAVYGVMIDKQNSKERRILLSKQWQGYDFPGGGIDLGEDTKAALIREVKEETGFKVKVGPIIYAQNSFFKLPFKGNFVHSIHLYYQCQIVGGQLTTNFLGDQEKKYAELAEWVSLTDFKTVTLCSSADRQELMKRYQANTQKGNKT